MITLLILILHWTQSFKSRIKLHCYKKSSLPQHHTVISPCSINSFSNCVASSSTSLHSGNIRFALSIFGSFVNGLLHKSIDFAVSNSSILHHVSHQSHSLGSEYIGTPCCAKLGRSWSRLAKLF